MPYPLVNVRCLLALMIAGLVQPLLAQDAPAPVFAPKQDTLPVAPPADALVLFDGDICRFHSMSGEAISWPIQDGCLISTTARNHTNHIVSTVHFRDAEIHVEFMVDRKAQGNSGVYLHGNYEMQIFDSHGKERVGEHDEGALYGFRGPLVNAARPADQWQVYDIQYRAPRRNEQGRIIQPGQVTAWLNGQLVQDQTKFEEPRSVYHPFRYGNTPYLDNIYQQIKQSSVGPLFLQDHGSPTKFRNVWIRPLDDLAREYSESAHAVPVQDKSMPD